MPAVEYVPLDGLSVDHSRELTAAFFNAFALVPAFTAGPSVEEEAYRQGNMALLNKAEELGLIAVPKSSEPSAIIRPDADGNPDDIAISGDLVRLERMDRNRWWAAVYRDGKRVTFEISARKGRKGVSPIIDVTVVEDAIGCADDTPETEQQVAEMLASITKVEPPE